MSLAALAADAVLVVHLGFIFFVVAGAMLVWRWPWVALLHVPAAVWGVIVEWTGWGCPLTPLEVGLRRLAGEAGYAGGFIEHYLFPLIYPQGLTRQVQIVLGVVVLAINVVLYGLLLGRRRRAAA